MDSRRDLHGLGARCQQPLVQPTASCAGGVRLLGVLGAAGVPGGLGVLAARAFAEGYAEVGEGRINPFVDRLRLNQAAFMRGDRQALQTMAQRYGVRYLVIDQVNGYRADLPALERAGRTVYRGRGSE